MSEPRQVTLTGWGGTAPSSARVHTVGSPTAVASVLARSGPRGSIARGLGRSYGDAAQRAGGDVITLSAHEPVMRFDRANGALQASAGCSLDDLLQVIVPTGWFLPVVPGTRYVTLGGCVAADVHGKNHEQAGSFAQHVRSLEILLANGEVRRVTPHGDPDLFWATAGGMGLTGIILNVELKLRRIESSWMMSSTERTRNLDDTYVALERSDTVEHTVAWLDGMAYGGDLGRGVVSAARHAVPDELPSKSRTAPLTYEPRTFATGPPALPRSVVNRVSAQAFNELWYLKSPRRTRSATVPLASFFHPLDIVQSWNRLYGPRGFLQYQYVVPAQQRDTVRRTLEHLRRSGVTVSMAILKRLGPESPGLLSFPFEGWTLAVDIPVTDGLASVLTVLDEQVLGAGGRLYLAKDGRSSGQVLAAGYPGLEAFRRIRAEVDPQSVFRSDLSVRLGL